MSRRGPQHTLYPRRVRAVRLGSTGMNRTFSESRDLPGREDSDWRIRRPHTRADADEDARAVAWGMDARSCAAAATGCVGVHCCGKASSGPQAAHRPGEVGVQGRRRNPGEAHGPLLHRDRHSRAASAGGGQEMFPE